jgi:hypothetical protein
LLKPFMGLPVNAEIIVAHADTSARYPEGLACETTPHTVSGEAFTAQAIGTELGTPPQDVLTVRYADAMIPATGGVAGPVHLDSVLVNPPDVLSTQTTENTACGWTYGSNPCAGLSAAGPPAATARSQTHSVNLFDGVITADVVDVSCTSTTDSGASTTCGAVFTNLHIVSTLLPGGSLDVNGTPNPNSGYLLTLTPSGDYVSLVINEQSTADGVADTSGTVTAIHAIVYSPTGGLKGEVWVGFAHSDAHKGTALQAP